jgi:FMN phosphatase YigB (HAD superfamily)
VIKKALLFDLDGTLLPMDREEFVRAYLPGVSAAAALIGDPKLIGRSILQASQAMVDSVDPDITLETVFWRAFVALSGITRAASEPLFNRYYLSAAFDRVREVTPFEPLVPQIIDAAKQIGLRLVLATSPLFPRVAVEKRILWAGLDPSDFEHITSFEQYYAAKPNIEYYQQLLAILGLSGEQCIMVGNDAREDLPAPNRLGMETFLVRNHAIIPKGYEYHCDHEGSYEDLLTFIKGMGELAVCS